MKKTFISMMLFSLFQSAHAQIASSTQYQYNAERTTSAIAIATKQEALDGNMMSNAVQESLKALATAFGSVFQTEKIKRAYFEYNSATGQPISLQCDAVHDNGRTVLTKEQKDIFTNALTKVYASVPYDSAETQEKDSLDAHNSAYCSVSQAHQGMCKLVGNGLQNADANYAVSYMMPTLQGDAHIAGLQFASNLGKFTQQISPEACSSKSKTDCQTSQLNNLDLMAESSMVNAILFDQIHSRMRPQLVGKVD